MTDHTSHLHAPGDLGLALQQARLAQGLSQVDLAARVGVSQRSISEIESGRTTIQLRKIFDLLSATGVELSATWSTADPR